MTVNEVDRRPTVLGTGFIALDVVVPSGAPERPTWAGGTCGNVLAILGSLGWGSYPLARLESDGAGARVREDLSRFGVSLDFAYLAPTASTPVIIHHIQRRSEGPARHRFSVNCPECGARMPSYRPVTRAVAEEVSGRLPRADVFFLDRVSRAALVLAEKAASAGAMIVFEPSAVGEPSLFREALHLTHVLKYSRDRLGWLADDTEFDRTPLVEIETLGRDGLRYRASVNGLAPRWRTLPSFELDCVADSAGAGDWCTAGLLHSLGAGGWRSLARTTLDEVEDALRFGQAAGAWTCAFEGARGGMYRHGPTEVLDQISSLKRSGVQPECPTEQMAAPADSLHDPSWCRACASPSHR
jgi:fructokinase